MRSLVLFSALLLATPTLAQSGGEITLNYDDGSGVSGELVAFSDGLFRIQASVGLLTIPAADVACVGAACPEGTTQETSTTAVTLIVDDGTVRISGDLMEFSNGEYVVATKLGEIRISADIAECTGVGCALAVPPADPRLVLTNGGTTIAGILRAFEDGAYILDVDQIGRMRIPAEGFTCEGEACP